jgi:predicted negative regulator of RcsB-dependent stress response
VRTYERHQLKQDKFAATVSEKLTWAVEHRSKLVAAAIVVGLVAIALIGGWWLWGYRNQQANLALGTAMQTYNASITVANVPPEPGTVSFPSSQARARAAYGEFHKVAERYGLTKAGQMAKYMAATSALDMGDNKTAESELKAVADSGNKDVASLAKMALAGLYRDTNRNPEALKIYQALLEQPTLTVPKGTVQLELASLYERTGQAPQAGKLYSEIMKDAPGSAAASIANRRLSQMK